MVIDERLTRRVGAVTIALLLAAIGFFVFVYDRIEWGVRVRVRAYFHHTANLREGAPVIVAGDTVGSVEAIEPLGRSGPSGDAAIAVTLALDVEDLVAGGDIYIAGRGPLSARHVEIGPSPRPDGPVFAEGDEFRGIDPPQLDRVLNRTWDNLNTARRFAEEVAPEFLALRDQLRTLTTTIDGLVPDTVGRLRLGFELQGLAEQARQLRDVALGGDPGLANLAAMLDRAAATVTQARAMLDTLRAQLRALSDNLDAARRKLGDTGPSVLARAELAIERIRGAIDKLDPLLAKVEDLAARIQRGEGSIGRLTQDPEFSDDAKELGKALKRAPWRVIARPKD
jgi:phospholipid/cholesterol/gamma-HCH transport system substrate-binding protein